MFTQPVVTVPSLKATTLLSPNNKGAIDVRSVGDDIDTHVGKGSSSNGVVVMPRGKEVGCHVGPDRGLSGERETIQRQ